MFFFFFSFCAAINTWMCFPFSLFLFLSFFCVCVFFILPPSFYPLLSLVSFSISKRILSVSNHYHRRMSREYFRSECVFVRSGCRCLAGFSYLYVFALLSFYISLSLSRCLFAILSFSLFYLCFSLDSYSAIFSFLFFFSSSSHLLSSPSVFSFPPSYLSPPPPLPPPLLSLLPSPPSLPSFPHPLFSFHLLFISPFLRVAEGSEESIVNHTLMIITT